MINSNASVKNHKANSVVKIIYLFIVKGHFSFVYLVWTMNLIFIILD